VQEVYGDRVAYVPYTIPGFALAKSVADVFDKNPKVEGLVLLQRHLHRGRHAARLMIA
jgi:rhamnose utilization protein RhaD (predicted bifunctional aldolase and dehydrogenase)